jgi:predicted phosphodiesterase
MEVIVNRPDNREIFMGYYTKYRSMSEYKRASRSDVTRAILEDYPNLGIAFKTGLNYISEDKSSLSFDPKTETMLDSFDFDDETETDIEIPKSFYTEAPVFTIPDSVEKLLVIGDLHIPFHHPEAIRTALRYGKENGCDGIMLNGDIMDCHYASRFLRDPQYRNAKLELDVGKAFMESLRKYFPESKIYYKIGNHDERIALRLIENQPEYYDLEELKIENLLGLNDLDVTTIDPYSITQFGKLNIMHGHEFKRHGIHVTYTNLLKSMENILFCHYHKTSEYIHTMLSGDVLGSWSVGCLCGLRPKYLPYNNWNLGFAEVKRRGHNGSFEVSNKKIINGRIL